MTMDHMTSRISFDADRAAQELAREHGALASMQGADSRRIDGLVSDVGEIKGDMRSLMGGVERLGSGVEKLQESMAAFNRHAVSVEHQASDIATLRRETASLDKRLRDIEVVLPQLQEVRGDIRKGMIFVIAGVGAALLMLVIKKP